MCSVHKSMSYWCSSREGHFAFELDLLKCKMIDEWWPEFKHIDTHTLCVSLFASLQLMYYKVIWPFGVNKHSWSHGQTCFPGCEHAIEQPSLLIKSIWRDSGTNMHGQGNVSVLFRSSFVAFAEMSSSHHPPAPLPWDNSWISLCLNTVGKIWNNVYKEHNSTTYGTRVRLF